MQLDSLDQSVCGKRFPTTEDDWRDVLDGFRNESRRLSFGFDSPTDRYASNGLNDHSPRDERISAGHVVGKGQFPWFAELIVEFGRKRMACGGVLIHHNLVLTAAHCLYGGPGPRLPNRVGVWLGHENKRGGYSLEQKIESRLYAVPNSFVDLERWGETSYDFGMIKLPRSVKYSRLMQPVCLPNESQRRRKLKGCMVAGLGLVDENREEFARNVLAMPMRSCTRPSPVGTPTDQLCLETADRRGHPGRPCPGDSGGPLVCRDQSGEHNWVAGLVSNGPEKGCRYGVIQGMNFLNVLYHREAILEMARQLLAGKKFPAEEEEGEEEFELERKPAEVDWSWW